MRILHFSDVHLREPAAGVRLREWLGKRLFGGANLLLGRRHVFEDAPAKVEALDRFRRELGVDLVICTGDLTALGTRGEFDLACRALEPLSAAPLGHVFVPGNHDLYARDAVRREQFRKHFGAALETDCPEYRVEDGPWPLVRLVGDDVAVVAVNSARPNPLPWRSSGRIPDIQVEALGRVLADDRLRGRFVFVATHYAPRLEDGGPDKRLHRLVNADAFLDACRDVSPGAILCGHVHRRYSVRVEGVKPRLFCAGSATKRGVEGLWVFDVEGGRCRATPGRWAGDQYVRESGSGRSIRFSAPPGRQDSA
ncbi:MAG: metallophosphoesterase [Planctomycetota bacterium]